MSATSIGAYTALVSAGVLFVSVAFATPETAHQDTPTSTKVQRGAYPPGSYTVSYNVADLAVWRPRGKLGLHYDPSVLVALIKSSIAPQSWGTIGDITASEVKGGIAVTQTGENHRQISELISSLRDETDRFEQAEHERRSVKNENAP